MNYKIGDRVIVREWDDMPETFRINKDGASMTARGKCCGKRGIVSDILNSVTEGTVYQIKTDDGLVSSLLYKEDWLKLEPKNNVKFYCRYDVENEKLYLTVDDGSGTPESAYGYVQSQDTAGYVAAFSWAAGILNTRFKNKEKK